MCFAAENGVNSNGLIKCMLVCKNRLYYNIQEQNVPEYCNNSHDNENKKDKSTL